MTTPRRSDRLDTTDGPPGPPRTGDVLEITRAASVQFRIPILFRVIRVHDWPTYAGWLWLDGYQLNDTGEAVERRSIFVQAAGLRRMPQPPAARGYRPVRPVRRANSGASPMSK